MDGRATLELVMPRDRLAVAPPPRTEYRNAPEALAEFQRVYRLANDPRLALTDLTIEKGVVRGRLDVPRGATGVCHVRIFVEGADACAVGSVATKIESPKAK